MDEVDIVDEVDNLKYPKTILIACIMQGSHQQEVVHFVHLVH